MCAAVMAAIPACCSAGDKDGSGTNIYLEIDWIQLSSFLLEGLLVII